MSDQQNYFEQFTGDVPYVDIWRDKRIQPLIDALKLDDFSWTSSTVTNRPGMCHPELPLKVTLASSQSHAEIIAEIRRFNGDKGFAYDARNISWSNINFIEIAVEIKYGNINIYKDVRGVLGYHALGYDRADDWSHKYDDTL